MIVRNQLFPQTLTFRKATISEAQLLFALHVKAVTVLCAVSYPQRILRTWFSDRDVDFYVTPVLQGKVHVLESDGIIIGFIELNPSEITNVFVDPKFARRGFGSLLVNEGLHILRAAGSKKVEIEATLNAVEFYRKHGFVEINRGVWITPRGKVKIPVVFMEKELDP